MRGEELVFGLTVVAPDVVGNANLARSTKIKRPKLCQRWAEGDERMVQLCSATSKAFL